jgi:hypothetical protein
MENALFVLIERFCWIKKAFHLIAFANIKNKFINIAANKK